MADKTWKAASRDSLFQGLGAAAVAVFCYSTARLVPALSEVYWAPIAAVVVLYPDREATKKAARDRFIGTIMGSLIGWASAALWDQHILLFGLAILIAVGLCDLLQLQNASRLCAVAVTVITLVPRSEPAYRIALHRFVEVSYGVACALLYTVLVDLGARRWRRHLAD